MELFIGIMIPFLGTCLGSASVFFMKNELKPLVQKGLLGFASGGNGGGFCVVPADPGYGYVRLYGKICFRSGGSRFSFGDFFLFWLWTVWCPIYIWVRRNRKDERAT